MKKTKSVGQYIEEIKEDVRQGKVTIENHSQLIQEIRQREQQDEPNSIFNRIDRAFDILDAKVQESPDEEIDFVDCLRDAGVSNQIIQH